MYALTPRTRTHQRGIAARRQSHIHSVKYTAMKCWHRHPLLLARSMIGLAAAASLATMLRPAGAWQTMIIDSPTPVAADRTIPADTSLAFKDGGHF